MQKLKECGIIILNSKTVISNNLNLNNMEKFNFDEIAKAINYYDEQFTFFKTDGKELDCEELFERGMNEDDFPWSIEQFKKLGYGFSKEEFECNDNNDRMVYYTFDDEDDSITISSDNFSIKECFIILDIIKKHLQTNIGRELFVSFGNAEDDTHTLFHGESTAYGMWWEDFYKLYISRLNGENKLSKVYICIEDYQTDEEGWSTKDRVVHIVLV